jgi:hypothetical protein
MKEFIRVEPFDGERSQNMWAMYLGPIRKKSLRATDRANVPLTNIVTADLDSLIDEVHKCALSPVASGNTVELHHFPRT